MHLVISINFCSIFIAMKPNSYSFNRSSFMVLFSLSLEAVDDAVMKYPGEKSLYSAIVQYGAAFPR